MNSRTLIALLAFSMLAPFGLWHCSSGSSSFNYDTLSEVLDNADPTAEGTFVDFDGDGIADGIDTDGDGNSDIDFDPGDLGDPIDDGSSSSSSSSGGGDDGTVDPVDPIRTDNGNCVITAGTAYLSGNQDSNITASDLGSNTSVLVNVTSNSTDVTIDLSGATNLKRIAIHMKGNSNTISVRNSTMEHGFCNQGSGGSNSVILETTNSANIVDLMSGTGGSNNLDSLFTPALGLIYNLSGNSHCISYTAGTELLSSSSNDNDHTIYDNDTNVGTCL